MNLRTAIAFLLLMTVGGIVGGLADSGSNAPAPVRSWELIVIHHSATPTGSAELFDASHRARGMVNGLAYHFVIDNGTDGRPDGFIETGRRWVKQLPGGHCRQTDINAHGIGICLVGDFMNQEPTARQIDALVLLVRGLQEQFHIANENIVGHGEVFGEFSKCPGRKFPWDELRRRLKPDAAAGAGNHRDLPSEP